MASHPVEQRREGFGTILLRHSLTYDLGAEVTRVFEPSGFRLRNCLAARLERFLNLCAALTNGTQGR